MKNKKHYITFTLFTIFFQLVVSVNVFSQLSTSDSLKLISYINSAKKAKADKDNLKAAHYYNKAGVFCLKTNKQTQAIEYFRQSAIFNSKLKNNKELKKIYSNLGLIYFNLEKLDKAFSYFDKSLKIRKLLGNKADIASGLIDLGYVLTMKGNYNQSIASVKKALIIAQNINNSKLILVCYRMLANNYSENKEIKKAEEYFEKYSTFSRDYQDKKKEEREEDDDIQSTSALHIQEAENRANKIEFELIAKLNKANEEASEREKTKLADSLALIEINLSNKEAKIKLLNQDKELNDIRFKEEQARRENQKIYIFFGIGVIILILAIAFILFRNMRKEKKQKKKIEYKNKILQSAFSKLEENNKEIAQQKQDIELKSEKITIAFDKIAEQNENIEASIRYARNIQKALLPEQVELEKYFSDSFILFLPRDKVSGDFYWFNEAKYKDETGKEKMKFFVSAIDCTGHGVPGALLSMIGFNSLENIVTTKKILRPDLILQELHNEVRHTLRQETTDNKDGMDMSLCAYNPDKNEIEFAGAKNPIIYIKNNELFHVKGGAKPIAGGKFYHELMKDYIYENHIIPITEPTTFYIFSDGFPDQLGGPNKRKYLIKRFKTLLLEIHQNPMKDQSELLNLILEQWRGEEKQIDDIIIIGFKLFPK